MSISKTKNYLVLNYNSSPVGISTKHESYLVEGGTKVCVEIAMMALDAGTIDYGRQIIAIGGSGRGADTVCRLTPEYTSDLMGTKIHEILCKPSLEE